MEGQTTYTGSAARNYQQVTATPTPLAGVPSALAGIDATLSELGNALSLVEDRLDRAGALRPAQPRADNPNKVAPAFNSSLANSLDDQRLRVSRMIVALQDLQERIDL